MRSRHALDEETAECPSVPQGGMQGQSRDRCFASHVPHTECDSHRERIRRSQEMMRRFQGMLAGPQYAAQQAKIQENACVASYLNQRFEASSICCCAVFMAFCTVAAPNRACSKFCVTMLPNSVSWAMKSPSQVGNGTCTISW